MARSSDDMIQLISAYLGNPSREADGRGRIVETECSVNLGRAGKAVGKEIFETVN